MDLDSVILNETTYHSAHLYADELWSHFDLPHITYTLLAVMHLTRDAAYTQTVDIRSVPLSGVVVLLLLSLLQNLCFYSNKVIYYRESMVYGF